MLETLQKHIEQKMPYLVNKKLLIAVSGGIDSMVLLDLFQQLSFDLAIAHCNFQLRKTESDTDQLFVENYGKSHQILVFKTQFDTEKYAKTNKLSIQIAARELRYNWFYHLLETEKFDYILTAHHADDAIETFFINLSRGTGLEGLTGIQEVNNRVVRPLLSFSRLEIENYAKANSIRWREDSSNASDYYLRNRIRHHLVPVFKEINPNFINSFLKTKAYLQETNEMVHDSVSKIYQEVVCETKEGILFDITKLLELKTYKGYLFRWLKKYGFTAWEDIYNLPYAETGKQIFSEEYRLVKNPNFLTLVPIKKEFFLDEYLILEKQSNVKIPLNLIFSTPKLVSETSNTSIFVDDSKLIFPLVLRKPKAGDFFYPLGMNGKSKKVNKFLRDEKLSVLEKETTWLLCSANQIVWVVGIRLDERFKINKNTIKIRNIKLICS